MYVCMHACMHVCLTYDSKALTYEVHFRTSVYLHKIHIGCAYMNFVRQSFRKLSSDRHTYRQADTTEIIYHAASRVVHNNFSQFSGMLRENRPSPSGWLMTVDAKYICKSTQNARYVQQRNMQIQTMWFI